MQKIMKTCPSISPHNFHFTTAKIFPQQGNVNERRHLSTSHPRLTFLLLSHPSSLSAQYKTSPSPPPYIGFSPLSSFPLFLILYLFLPSQSTCASHHLLLLSLLKAKKSQISPLNRSYFNGKQLDIKKGDE